MCRTMSFRKITARAIAIGEKSGIYRGLFPDALRLWRKPQIRFYNFYTFWKFFLCIFSSNRISNNYIFTLLPVSQG